MIVAVVDQNTFALMVTRPHLRLCLSQLLRPMFEAAVNEGF